MSTESDLNDELQLPSELIAFEAALRGFSPSTGSLNREVVMYEAGWAAAMARQSRSKHWLLPMIAGAAASLLLVLVVQQQRNARVEKEPVQSTHDVASVTREVEATPDAFVQAPRKLFAGIQRPLTRRRAVDLDWEQYVAADSSEASTHAVESNYRGLLKNLLSGEKS